MVRNSARFLAPVALAAVAVGVYLIVQANVATTHSTRMHTTRDTVRHAPRRHRRPAPRYYTVRSGDTLSEIAAKTKVPLGELSTLNPSVSAAPDSLHTGQRLRLRR